MMANEFCPQCGTARTGAFRFCRSCQFDFDTSAAQPARPRRPRSRFHRDILQRGHLRGHVASDIADSAAPPLGPAPGLGALSWWGRSILILVVLVLALAAVGALGKKDTPGIAGTTTQPGGGDAGA